MKHRTGLLVVGLVVGWLAGPPALAWMINQDDEQITGSDQNSFEMVLDKHVTVTGGGKEPMTNPFPNPNRQHFIAAGAWPFITQTGIRFLGIDKGIIVHSPGVKQHFGIFGDGPNIPRIIDKRWKFDSTTTTSVPAPSVSFKWLSYDHATGQGSVEVTVSNQTGNTIKVGKVGYRILKINSFTIANLNRTHMPPVSFTASGVPDDTAVSASGGSMSFTVTGVTLDDDIVVYVAADLDPPVAIAAPSGTWVAWCSGTYIPARLAYLGRVGIMGVNPAARAFEVELAQSDLRVKTPFDMITPVIGPEARFMALTRGLYASGPCVPNMENPPPGPGQGCAMGGGIYQYQTDLMLSTTDAGGMKLSYLRTAAQDVYRDVCVKARIMPGASTTTTTVAQSDDFGGPVAIRIGPTGGSYFASAVTGEKNQIALKKDSVDGWTQTTLAFVVQWANGDPIALDHNVPQPVPPGDNPPPYEPTLYDVELSAVGTDLTLIVTEVGNPAHTVTLTANDSNYARGYVGLRTQRNGELDYPSDQFGDESVKFETMVQDYEIRRSCIGPAGPTLLRLAVLSAMEDRVDNPAGCSGMCPSERSDEIVSDLEIANMLAQLGFDVTTYAFDRELDDYTYEGAAADGPGAPGFGPPLNGNYDVIWIPGGAGSSASKFFLPWVNMAVVSGESLATGTMGCDSTGAVPVHPGTACTGTKSEARIGLYTANSGDFRGGAGSAWGDRELGPTAQDLRIPTAAEGGDPTHPLVAGLPENAKLQVYGEMFRHMQAGGHPVAPAAKALAVERIRGALPGPPGDGVLNSHPAWGIVSIEGGSPRLVGTPPGAFSSFPARTVFMFFGDSQFHKLTCVGRELGRRAAYWALGLPIPPSPWMLYGDFDEDGDVDATDQGHFTVCVSGSGVPLNFEGLCADADSDGDGDVDVADGLVFDGCKMGAASCPCPKISIPGAPPVVLVPPTVVAAVSRRAHGSGPSQQDFDIDLPLDPPESAGIECRAGGPTTIVLTFSEPVHAGGAASVGRLIDGPGHDQKTVLLADVPDESCLAITLHGIIDLDGNPLAGDNDVHVCVLAGDVTGDRVVNLNDLSAIKSQLFDPLTQSNFRTDVYPDAVINIVDLQTVKGSTTTPGLLFHTAACP